MARLYEGFFSSYNHRKVHSIMHGWYTNNRRLFNLLMCGTARMSRRFCPEWDLAVSLAERWIDGHVKRSVMTAARRAADDEVYDVTCNWCMKMLTRRRQNPPWGSRIHHAPFRDLLPRRVPSIHVPRHIRNIAEGIYVARAFHELPAFTDELIMEGIEHPLIINHFRSGKQHFRGCWALELLRGTAHA